MILTSKVLARVFARAVSTSVDGFDPLQSFLVQDRLNTHSIVFLSGTCHGIFPQDIFDQLPEASEDEEDMLDMAPGLEETSRLCCQVTVEEYMDGMTVTMPQATRNFYVDGHVPKPH